MPGQRLEGKVAIVTGTTIYADGGRLALNGVMGSVGAPEPRRVP